MDDTKGDQGVWMGPVSTLSDSMQEELLPIFENIDENATILDNIIFQIAATGRNPAKDNFPGPHNFNILLDGNKGGAAWNYSSIMDKLYIKINTKIQLGFEYNGLDQEDLFVRALPIFPDSNNFTNPVQRCYAHSNLQDAINKGFDNAVNHIIRIEDPLAVYQHDEQSGRFSVVVPMGPKQNGTEKVYKPLSFACQNSCLAIKRPLAVIFTLEDKFCQVLGRRTLNVKVCSGPNRDRKLEEEAASQEMKEKRTKKRRIASNAEDKNSEITISVPTKVLKLVVSYAGLRIREVCDDEKRKPDDTEKQCLNQYGEILEMLRQEKKQKIA